MPTLIYAGIGSRARAGISRAAARTGPTLRLAGARRPASGPSTSRGRAITGMRGRTAVRFPGPRSLGCMEIAARLHPAWHRCSPAARKLHARNAAILLSSELDCPVDAVVAWTRDSAVTGGTGMGLRIAAALGIPVLNLGAISPRESCERLLAIRRSSRPSVSVLRARAVLRAGRTPGRAEGEGLPSRCWTRQPAEETVPCSISTLKCIPVRTCSHNSASMAVPSAPSSMNRLPSTLGATTGSRSEARRR